jgi:Flp pilus assembly pilin Flp
MRTQKKISKQKRQRGQAIVEYSAVLAFVAVMIIMALNLSKSSLFGGISSSYSSVSGTLDKLNQAVIATGNGQ